MNRIAVQAGVHGGFEWAWASRACAGERVNGDLARVAVLGDRLHVALIDALGHGVVAHAVARRIDAFLVERDLSNPVAELRAVHHLIVGSVGAAVGLGAFDPATAALSWSAVGNTIARRLGDRPARLVSRDGIVGQFLPDLRGEALALGEQDVIVLHTDGVPSSTDFDSYPQIRVQGAEAIAHTIVHRFGRATDDATVVVLRRAR